MKRQQTLILFIKKYTIYFFLNKFKAEPYLSLPSTSHAGVRIIWASGGYKMG